MFVKRFNFLKKSVQFKYRKFFDAHIIGLKIYVNYRGRTKLKEEKPNVREKENKKVLKVLFVILHHK